jgi:hypothetical protein
VRFQEAVNVQPPQSHGSKGRSYLRRHMSVNTRSLLRHLVPGKIEKESALITGALLGFLGTDGQALRYELITLSRARACL